MANKYFCLFTFIKSIQVCLWISVFMYKLTHSRFPFLLLLLSQATTPSHSVRPCQLLWFRLLLNPSAGTLFSGPTALHFISFFTVSSLLYGGRILFSCPTLCSCAKSRGSAWNFMSCGDWWEYASMSACCSGSGCLRWRWFWMQSCRC